MKKKFFKYLLNTSSAIALCTNIYTTNAQAAGIPIVSTMIGNVSLGNLDLNWLPPFISGNTIAVGVPNCNISTNISSEIGAIRLDNDLNEVSYYVAGNPIIKIGSIAGKAKLKQIKTAGGPLNGGQHFILTGNAGVNNNPAQNDYSGLEKINFTYTSTLEINAPITLDAQIVLSTGSTYVQSIIDINDNVTISNGGIANISNVNIASDKTLILSANNMNLKPIFDFGDTGSLTITGSNNNITGQLLNTENATLNVKGNLTSSIPDIKNLILTNIDNGIVYTIDAVNGDIDLLSNNTQIVFNGASSELDLVNTGTTDKQFTLYANLNPSTTQDIYGKIRVSATTNGLTIANNGNTVFTIGQDNTHRLLNFTVDGGGTIVINPNIFTKLLNMNSTGQVTLTQPLDLGAGGSIAFGANGTLFANGVTGSITTSAPGQGTLMVNGVGVSGTIGNATNSLLAVNVNANGNVTLGGAIYANTFNINNAGANITAQGQITSNIVYNEPGTLNIQNNLDRINFNNQPGILNVNGNAYLSNLSNGNNAFLNINSGTTTGVSTIGVVKNITIGSNNSSATLSVTPTDNANFQSNITFGSQGGTFIINGGEGVNVVTLLGAIINGDKATLDLNVNFTVSDPSAGTINEVDVADGVTYTIDAKGNNVNLFQNNAKIVFEGANSELDLINSVTNAGSFTLYASLNPYNDAPEGQGDGYGIIGMNAVANSTLTITSNGGPFIIGQDASHRIQNLKLTGGDNSSIVIDDTMTIYTQLVTMGSTGKVTFGNPLTSNITFTADGTLIVNGVTGSITTSAPGQGTLMVNGGSVGSIGDITNGLKLVNIGTNAATFTSNIYAPVKFTADNVIVTLGGVGNQTITSIDFAGHNSTIQINDGVNLSSNIDNSGATDNGTITFKGNSTTSSNIGTSNAIKAINIGAGEVKLYVNGGGNVTIKAQNVNLTNSNSILTFYDGNLTTFEGDINNTTGKDQQGILNLAYDATSNTQITGNIGDTGVLATINVLAGAATFNSQIVNAADINLVSTGATLNLGDGITVSGNISSGVQGGGVL